MFDQEKLGLVIKIIPDKFKRNLKKKTQLLNGVQRSQQFSACIRNALATGKSLALKTCKPSLWYFSYKICTSLDSLVQGGIPVQLRDLDALRSQ